MALDFNLKYVQASGLKGADLNEVMDPLKIFNNCVNKVWPG